MEAPPKGVLAKQPPLIELRLNAGECAALGLGMIEVQYHASKVALDEWVPELNEKINCLARYIVKFSEDKTSKSHRVRTDALSLAITMFGLAQLRKDLRRGLFKFYRWPNRIATA